MNAFDVLVRRKNSHVKRQTRRKHLVKTETLSSAATTKEYLELSKLEEAREDSP